MRMRRGNDGSTEKRCTNDVQLLYSAFQLQQIARTPRSNRSFWLSFRWELIRTQQEAQRFIAWFSGS
jgi:hypothetical protein